MKKYFATRDIAISGVEDDKGRPRRFTAGQELVGVRESKCEWLVKIGQARKEIIQPAAGAGTKGGK